MFQVIIKYFYFLVLFVAPVLSVFLKKFESLSGIELIGFMDEVALVAALPLAYRGFIYLHHKRYGFFALALFLMYLIVGIISGLIHYVPAKQMLFQIALELKYPLMLCSMFGLPDKIWFVRRFFGFAKLILLASIPLILWQFSEPRAYHLFFMAGGDHGVLFLPGGMTLQRASGFLWSPGQFAMFAGVAFIYFFFDYLHKKTYPQLAWVVITFFLLFSSLSRLEIAGTIFSIWFSFFLSQKGTRRIITFGVVLMLLIPLASFLAQMVLLAYDRLGLHNLYLSQAARVVFYYYSVVIAVMYFPFGAGLGTYGGYSAVVYDSDIYYRLHFYGYSWFQEKWMTDTFWPHILGETGILGMLFYFGSLYYLWRVVIIRAKKVVETVEHDAYKAMVSRVAVGIFALVCINSLAAPIFYSVVTLMPCLLLIAVAATCQQEDNTVSVV